MGQNPKSGKLTQYTAIRGSFGLGKTLNTNEFLDTANAYKSPIDQFHGFGMEVLFQSTGTKEWQQIFHFPVLGFGIRKSFFPQTDELGSPIAIYSLIESPFHRWKNSCLGWGFQFGVNLNWNHYNEYTNPYNKVIGTWMTAYAHLHLNYSQNIGKRMTLNADIGLSHSSNGGVQMPNYGINIFETRLGLSYNFKPLRPELNIRTLPNWEKYHELSLTVNTGTKQLDVSAADIETIEEFGNKSFPVYNALLVYQRKISRLSKLGGGIDFTIDESDNANGIVYGDTNSQYPPPMNEKIKFAAVIAYELTLNRLSLVLQPGFYFYRSTHDPKPFFYQRIGLHYEIYRGLYANTSLRAINFGQADWIEWGIGYRFKLK